MLVFALLITLQPAADSPTERTQAGIKINPRECQDDYVWIESMTAKAKNAGDGMMIQKEVTKINDELVMTIVPKKESPSPDWKSVQLVQDSGKWLYRVEFETGQIVKIESTEVKANSLFRSLWATLAAAKVDNIPGLLMQKCELGSCQTVNDQDNFRTLSKAQTPSASESLKYEISVKAKDDKSDRLKFSLDNSYLGLRKSWKAQGKQTRRLPHFSYDRICLLIEKKDACVVETTGQPATPTASVTERKELETTSESFKQAEDRFGEFSANLHLDIEAALTQARAKKLPDPKK